MNEAENPELAAGNRDLTAEDVRGLTGAATPQFALQLRDRVRKLIADLDADDPARLEGERQIARLERLAQDGQGTGHVQDHEQPLPSLKLDPERSEN